MKKRIWAILLSALLMASATACNYAPDNIPEHETESTVEGAANTEAITAPDSEIVVDTSGLEAIGLEPIYTPTFWNETDLGKRTTYFYDHINQNMYDQWLKVELLNGKRSEEEIYTDYLELWKKELTFTIENGQALFDGVYEFTPEQYSDWKSYLEQWMLSAESVLESEVQLLTREEMSIIGALIPHCQLIRQKVINTKEFLFRVEFCAKSLDSHEYRRVSIEWAPEADLLEFDINQNNETLKNTNKNLFDLKATDLLHHFYDNISFHSQPSIFDDWLVNELSNLDAEDPQVFDALQDVYYDYLSFWEDHEFTFTIENGDSLSENLLEYNEWKTVLEQLFVSTQTLSRCEFSILTVYNVEYFIPRCELMRQTVLGTKFFLYYWESQQNAIDLIDPHKIVVEWSVKG